MRNWPTAPIRWIRRLFGDSKKEMLSETGDTKVTTGGLAVLAVESLACDHIHRVFGSAHLSDTDLVQAGPTQPVLNAFGHPVREVLAEDPRSAVATASGLTLTGTRSAVFLSASGLARAHDQLYGIAGRHLPLVIHVTCRELARQGFTYGTGHSAYHAVAGTGFGLTFARNAQHAVDLSLVAHRVAELSLIPILVAMDASETATAAQSVRLPDAEMIERYLGPAQGEIECPTDAQHLIFGEHRPRIPQWFNLQRPTMMGSFESDGDFGLGRVGHAAFFAEPLAEIAKKAMDELSKLTGRPISFVTKYKLDDAQYALVAQGSMVEVAEAVADHLRSEKDWRIGVLGINWQRPFPAEDVLSALKGVEQVVVVERNAGSSGHPPPLFQQMKTVVDPGSVRLRSARFGFGGLPVTASQLADLCAKMVSPGLDTTPIYLGVEAEGGSEFPKRDGLLRASKRLLLDSGIQTIKKQQPIDVRGKSAKTVTLYAPMRLVDENTLLELAQPLAQTLGPNVRSRSRIINEEYWVGQVTVSKDPLNDPGDNLPSHLSIVAGLEIPAWVQPIEDLSSGGMLVVASTADEQDLTSRLMHGWCAGAPAKKIRVFKADSSLQESFALAAKLLSEEDNDLEALDFGDVGARRSKQELDVPALISRQTELSERFDNLPRLWGEIMQPRLNGEAPQPIPDPLLAIGAAPAHSAAFCTQPHGLGELPEIDTNLCTGCGKCWTFCPDAAIGVVAIGTEALLDAAAELAANSGESNPAADKLKRAHKQLASRIDSVLAKQGETAVSSELLTDSCGWLADKMGIGADEKGDFEAAFEATLAELVKLDWAVTDLVFQEPHKKSKGSGSLLGLAIDPHCCKSCGICVNSCPESAVQMVPASNERVEALSNGWHLWENVPDTPGPLIADLSDQEIGHLGAIQMSRHCLKAMSGKDGAEPGSGERLATRLALAVTELHGQKAAKAAEGKLLEAAGKLREQIKQKLNAALPSDDLEKLHDALAEVHGPYTDLKEISEKLDAKGTPATVDGKAVRRLVELTRRLENYATELVQGIDGLGNARYGLVVSEQTARRWAAHFPKNAFFAPLVVEFGADAAPLAEGLAGGLANRWVRMVQEIRRTDLLLKETSDTETEIEEQTIAALTWENLEAKEHQGCAPVVVIADADMLTPGGLADLTRLLGSGCLAKVLLLDGHNRFRGADPALVALAQGNAVVASTSFAHPAHFYETVAAALDHDGPALIHVYAPSPQAHGFPSEKMIERAEMAVTSRIHPLLRYSPSADGVFGTRLSLAGNPNEEALWGTDGDGKEVTPDDFFAGEQRFAPESTSKTAATEERKRNWTILQEVAGIVTPFADQLRDRLEKEISEAKKAEIDAIVADHDGQMKQVQGSSQAAVAAQLKERLLQLAGYQRS